ncbi:MAG: hypothetical protein KID09_08795 [Paenibacillus macerans]|uniref:hypothetical protein n=1 Tax=Paenibacillus macerans TaxID=44252 RepID=UPI00242E86B4|nr:hypothetical protein [Paenibacillus macerans]MBS5910732.1 hypothetical protein [Paenibacillus macerans]
MPNKQKSNKRIRIVSELVVDRNGKVIGDKPEDFPSLTNKAKELIAYLETGKEYVIVDQTGKKELRDRK